MAKPKSRVASAAIAGMLGVPSPVSPPTSATTAPSSPPPAGHPPSPSPSPSTHAPEVAHPVRDRVESGIARADNALVLDPRRIARRGRYVRPFTEDRRFRDLLTAIGEAGNTIHVPVLVRVEGPPGSVEYVLVDGTHRVEAALRLGITVPAVNLGRITAEDAFAIQAMANEVRASMHVVDQAAYVLTLLGQGLSRDTVQRTTGFSAGRVSELSRIGALLAALSEEDRLRARRASRVTHRALRALVADASPDAFRQGVRALIAASRDEDDLDAFENQVGDTGHDGPLHHYADTADGLVAARYQLGRVSPQLGRRGRAPLGAGGVTFAVGRNARGTSVTFRMAWRARGVQADPELFLERVRDALQAIAVEATAHYEVAAARGRGRRARGARTRSHEWRDVIARDEAELGARSADRPTSADASAHEGSAHRDRSETIPDVDNPMPVPPSRRRSGDPYANISPRLLAGLSLPMLAERLKRHARAQSSDAERHADEARLRAREREEQSDT